MGNLLKAICKCGFESNNIKQGFGFNFFSNKVVLAPAYCDECGIVVSKDNSSVALCEQCGKRMTFYSQPTEEDVIGIGLPTFEPPPGLHHCPGCKQDKLAFTIVGSWD